MRLIVLASFISLSVAHIVGITGPTTYKPTASSSYPLTFTTINGPITNEDFSVAVGLDSNLGHSPPGLGTFIHNFDLENSGHGSTGNGNFTLQVPLPKDRFSADGKYVITTAVTNAVGALWNVQLLFFNLTITVTGVSGSPPPTVHAIHPGKDSSKCLAGTPIVGGAVTIETCEDSFAQQWVYSGGSFRQTFILPNSPPPGKTTTVCLDVTDGSKANGNKMQVWSCADGNKNQQFSVTADNRIAWTNMGECLDLTDGNTADGTVVQMWKCTDNNKNQVWNIV